MTKVTNLQKKSALAAGMLNREQTAAFREEVDKLIKQVLRVYSRFSRTVAFDRTRFNAREVVISEELCAASLKLIEARDRLANYHNSHDLTNY